LKDQLFNRRTRGCNKNGRCLMGWYFMTNKNDKHLGSV
jgi:hypothetical protein